MRLRVIDQGIDSAIASHAVPYGIADAMTAEAEPVLTLCTAEPHVSVGANQDLAREVDEDRCRALGLPVLRREVGGGVVLIDRNQLYFHFVFPRRLAPERAERLFQRFAAPVLATYADLGIAATHAAQEIQVGGRKLGAAAATEIGAAVVVAGSFLFDFDRDAFAQSLRISGDETRETIRRALDDRMVTLRELLPEHPDRDRIKDSFLAHIGRISGHNITESVPTSSEESAVAAVAARHAGEAWIRHRRRL